MYSGLEIHEAARAVVLETLVQLLQIMHQRCDLYFTMYRRKNKNFWVKYICKPKLNPFHRKCILRLKNVFVEND